MPRKKPSRRLQNTASSGPAAREGRRSRSNRTHQREKSKHKASTLWIFGHHAVAAVLANPQRKIQRLVATKDAAEKLESDPSVPRDALKHLHVAARADIDALAGATSVHQGIAVHTAPLEHNLESVLEQTSANERACIVLLDQVTDPHNVGAVLRSAAAFGAVAVIAPDRHAPDETGTMAKAASGALDKVPYIKTVNLVRTLEHLKATGFWLVGLAADETQKLSDLPLDGRIALVLGAEDEGLRRLVRESCDHLAALPITSDVESLNVSNAAAVALYEKARQSS